MRVVLDSGAWIAWFADEALADQVAPYLDHLEHVVVPAVVEFEVYRWALRRLDEERAATVAASVRRAVCVSLDGPQALEAAALAVRHQLAACDAMVYATALLHGATLITTDADLQGLPGVEFFAQPGRSTTSRKARRGAARGSADDGSP